VHFCKIKARKFSKEEFGMLIADKEEFGVRAAGATLDPMIPAL